MAGRPSTWTQEMDAHLIELIGQCKSSTEAAKVMGLNRECVKKRSVKIGVRFRRYTKLTRNLDSNHVAADERSRELLRKAGVRI